MHVQAATVEIPPHVFLRPGRKCCQFVRGFVGHHRNEVLQQLTLDLLALAGLAGLHRTFVSMVERGKRNVTIATVEKLAKALECRMADLMPDAESGKAA